MLLFIHEIVIYIVYKYRLIYFESKLLVKQKYSYSQYIFISYQQ